LGGLPNSGNPHFQNRAKWTEDVAPVEEYLLYKSEVLSSNPNSIKKLLKISFVFHIHIVKKKHLAEEIF
jgi:hypothetical protein